MRNSSKTCGKQTIPIFVLLAISFSALPAQAKYGGGTGEPNDPYLIFDANQMNAIGADQNDWDNHFLLCADIDLSEYTGTEFNLIGRGRYECMPPPGGFCWPVGDPFTGVFDGNSHTISNFTYQYDGGEFVGLFGCVDGENAQIKNLVLRDVNIYAHFGEVVGSLIGIFFNGTAINCHTQGGSVSGDYRVGGLVGRSEEPASIVNCYTDVNVSSHADIGGLVGWNFGTISNCYSKATVIGVYFVGGLTGRNFGAITDSYSTGSVSGNFNVGGLVGINDGVITASFWDTVTSGLDEMCGYGSGCDDTKGKITSEMQTKSTFTDAGWDFVNIWDICEGTNYPRFVLQIPPGDFICPDGVNFFDYSFFASQWAEDNCAASNDCDGRDLDLLGSVDIKDLRIFADNWLEGF